MDSNAIKLQLFPKRIVEWPVECASCAFTGIKAFACAMRDFFSVTLFRFILAPFYREWNIQGLMPFFHVFGGLMCAVGLVYLIYLLNKRVQFFEKLTLCTEKAAKSDKSKGEKTTSYPEAIYLFFFGYFIKHVGKFIDTEIGKKFTEFCFRFAALTRKSASGSSSKISDLFLFLCIVSACFFTMVIVNFIYSIFQGVLVSKGLVSTFSNSITEVLRTVFSLISGIFSFIEFTLLQVYLTIRQVIKNK